MIPGHYFRIALSNSAPNLRLCQAPDRYRFHQIRLVPFQPRFLPSLRQTCGKHRHCFQTSPASGHTLQHSSSYHQDTDSALGTCPACTRQTVAKSFCFSIHSLYTSSTWPTTSTPAFQPPCLSITCKTNTHFASGRFPYCTNKVTTNPARERTAQLASLLAFTVGEPSARAQSPAGELAHSINRDVCQAQCLPPLRLQDPRASVFPSGFTTRTDGPGSFIFRNPSLLL